jgi:hypothetical protein
VDNGHNPILSDKDMAYGYTLFSEGRPSVFFRDYFTYGLNELIDRLIWIRTTFLWGGTTERSGLGVYYNPPAVPQDVYVAKRNGGNGRPQAFLLINDHPTEARSVWVNTSPPWGVVYRDYMGLADDRVSSSTDGRVQLWAPARGFTIFVPDTTKRVNNDPYILTTPDLSAFVNTPFSYQIAGGDLNGDSLTYTIGGAPSWVSMSASGLLTGTPGGADTVTTVIAVTVADPWGGSSADTFRLTVRGRPLMDGIFEGATVWNPAVSVADTLPGWDGARAREVYVTQDDQYFYFGARIRGRYSWNWAFIINTKGGGGTSDSWSRNISYIHGNKPDYVLRGHFQGYAEFHTWNGSGWSGVGTPLAATEYAEGLTLDSLADGWVEARVLRSAVGDPSVLQVQFYITGPQNGNATYDACPDDQNTTAFTGSPTSLRKWALRGTPAITQWNLQFPGSATIGGGGSATIYARAFGLTITDTVGAAPGVSAWIGVNDAATNPATWTTWIPATYNGDNTGSDEYQAAIGPGLPGGTHYYASRFQYDDGPFLYGGYSTNGGGAWNGTTNVAGVLTIQAPPAVPVLVSPADGAVDVSPAVTLTWLPASGGTAYRAQVATDSLFAGLVADDSTLAVSTFAPPGLGYGTRYFWRVKAANVFGASEWSGVRSFSVFTPQSVTLGVGENWNMLSLPLTVVDGRRSVLFPSAVSAAYAFQSISGYVQRDTLSPGAGYWMKFAVAENVTVSGGRRPEDSIPVTSGWNLVGSITDAVPVSGIVQWPDSILRSVFYAYDGGYQAADSIRPGRAYWVKSASAGALLLSSPAPFAKSGTGIAVADPTAAWSALVIADAAGNHQRLFAAGSGDPALYEMPPMPPSGVFDARYASGSMLATGEESVVVTDAAYPVRVRLERGGGEGVMLLVNGRIVDGEEAADGVILMAPAELKVRPGASMIPAEFALLQNYPNPFNPSSKFEFRIPEWSHVNITVYDLLGRVVATLVDGAYEPGAYTVTFDGSRLASGIYIYRLTAGEYTDARRMVLLK